MYIIPLSLMLIPFIMTPKTITPEQRDWQDDILQMPYGQAKPKKEPAIILIRQDYEELELGKSVIGTPMKIGSQEFEHGLGTHSVSHIQVYSPEQYRQAYLPWFYSSGFAFLYP